MIDRFAGKDITEGFRRSPAAYCELTDYHFEMRDVSDTLGTIIYGKHAAIYENAAKNRGLGQKESSMNSQLLNPANVVAQLGYSREEVSSYNLLDKDARQMLIIGDRVYDFSVYVKASISSNKTFLSDYEGFLQRNYGKDMTEDQDFMQEWENNQSLRDCFNNLFIAGVIDPKEPFKCSSTLWLLIVASTLIVVTIVIKFMNKSFKN